MSAAAPGNAGSGAQVSGDGTPCEIADMLKQYCVRCHNRSSLSASDVPIASYADLTAASGSGTVAEKGLAKLKDARRPMPPRGQPTPSGEQVQAFSDWIAADYPKGGCVATAAQGAAGSPAMPSDYDTPTTCTSGKHWTSGNEESPKMHPGRACISCHESGEGPRFDFAGTLFATAHEPDDCNGAPLDTRVIITDATGRELVLTANSVGNFSANNTKMKMPYTARLESGDRVREMASEQENGDCNGCHSESGKNKAPGRIMAP